jgi:predicted DNA-binding protein (UPF0251 family)
VGTAPSTRVAQAQRARQTGRQEIAMEMHQVRYFLAVAEQLNFTKAAESCNVSQPSLTRAIKLLRRNSAAYCFTASARTPT